MACSRVTLPLPYYNAQCKKHTIPVLLRALSPKASLKIMYVTVTLLPNLKNLMNMFRSLNSAIFF
jgi:hypothetical protein